MPDAGLSPFSSYPTPPDGPRCSHRLLRRQRASCDLAPGSRQGEPPPFGIVSAREAEPGHTCEQSRGADWRFNPGDADPNQEEGGHQDRSRARETAPTGCVPPHEGVRSGHRHRRDPSEDHRPGRSRGAGEAHSEEGGRERQERHGHQFSFLAAVVGTTEGLGSGLPDWTFRFRDDNDFGLGPEVTSCLLE